MKQSDKPHLLILVKMWFDKVNGNTYHNVITRLPNALRIESGLTYGYENAYETTTRDLFETIGEEVTKYRMYFEIVNVSTKRELKACRRN